MPRELHCSMSSKVRVLLHSFDSCLAERNRLLWIVCLESEIERLSCLSIIPRPHLTNAHPQAVSFRSTSRYPERRACPESTLQAATRISGVHFSSYQSAPPTTDWVAAEPEHKHWSAILSCLCLRMFLRVLLFGRRVESRRMQGARRGVQPFDLMKT